MSKKLLAILKNTREQRTIIYTCKPSIKTTSNSFLFSQLSGIFGKDSKCMLEFFPLFMPDYVRSLNLIIILLIVASLLPLSKYANILNVIGKQGLYLKAQIFIILTNIIFSITLIHLGYGTEGVAIASLLSMILYVSLIRYLGSRAIKNLISKV